jgi:hypothetical protein
MPRAAALANASRANRRKSGQKTRSQAGGGGVNLPNLPQFEGPPPGTFDPGLEAEVRSAERGLIDLIEKTRLEGHRESVDTRQARRLLERKVRQGQADIARRRGYAVQDAGTQQQQLQTSFERDLEDLAIAKQRGEQDYQRKLTELQHSYATRAAVQQQASVAQGTSESGTEAASTAVRGANQTYDKGIVDQANQRFLESNALAEQRAREDYGTRSGLIQQGLGRDLTAYGLQSYRLGQEERSQRNKLALAIQRATKDRHTTLSHAKREYGIYATDVAEQAYYQAHQLNPNIVFPTPAAAAHPGGGGQAAARHPGIGVGRPVPFRPHTGNRAIGIGVGLGRARTYAFHRPYLRY